MPYCHTACAMERRFVTNMGAADPVGAGEATARLAKELGISLKIAIIEGDDVLSLITPETELPETGGTVASFGRKPIAANAYIGYQAMRDAWQKVRMW